MYSAIEQKQISDLFDADKLIKGAKPGFLMDRRASCSRLNTGDFSVINPETQDTTQYECKTKSSTNEDSLLFTLDKTALDYPAQNCQVLHAPSKQLFCKKPNESAYSVTKLNTILLDDEAITNCFENTKSYHDNLENRSASAKLITKNIVFAAHDKSFNTKNYE